VRLLAVHSLGRIGPGATEAAPTLRDALARDLEAIRRPAAEALKRIEPEAAPADRRP
jgi:HEAT repeat protein